MSLLKLHLLGLPRLEMDGTRVVIQRRKVMALLIYLAVTGESHSRDSLANMFWYEHDQGSSRAALRRTLSELQKILGKKLIHPKQDTLGLEPTPDLWLDIAEFQSRLVAYRSHGHHPDDHCPDCLMALTEAVSLYKGDFLAGFTLSDSPEFDEWQILQAEVLHRELIGALSRLVQIHSADGEIDPAIEAVHRWLLLDPVDEAAHRHLMQLYTWSGQRSDALRQYQECVRILERELGVPPLEETFRLYEHIRTQKDLYPPESIKASIPTLFSKRGTHQQKPNNLPAQLTSFVGRMAELSTVVEEISREEVHLLTLTGPAGVGKTRLALEVATLLVDQFEDGAFFVALAHIRDPALVGPTIAHVLGIRESQSKPPEKTVKDYLRDRQLLLVLDNFEHLTKAAPLVTEFLTVAPRVKVLVTSRTLLHVYGEHLHPVLPMKLPGAGSLAQSESMSPPEAVQLFLERAQAMKADFTLSQENFRTLVDICARLDGLPLAIELAAARVWQISPQAMLCEWTGERGGSPLQTLTSGPCDMPNRHKTLRNAIAWSYNLLEASEQRVFRQAGIFEGGWTLEAAAQIIGEPSLDSNYTVSVSSDQSLLFRLESLVDANLIKQSDVGGEIRFSMLETIRGYSLEQLVERGEVDSLRRSHAEFFLALAETAKPKILGSQQVVWVNRLEQEYENLRAALKWANECQEAEIALRLGSALGKFWYIFDPIYWSEGRRWLEQAINLRQLREVPLVVQANALNEAGVLAWVQGDYDHAIFYFQKCLEIRKTIGEKADIASALGNLGLVAREQHDLTLARAYQEECLALKLELGDRQGIATAFSNLGLVVADQGDIKNAIALYEKSLVINRELQNMTGLTLTMHNLGGLLVENRGDYTKTLSLLTGSLKLSRELGGHFFLISHTLYHLGTLFFYHGDYEQARSYYDESYNLSCESDNKFGIGHALYGIGRLAHLQGDYERAQQSYKQSIFVLQEIKGFVGITWSLLSLADLACTNGKPNRAAILLGAITNLCEITSTPLMQIRREEYDRIIASTCAQLDEIEFNDLWGKGQEMLIDQAIVFAIGENAEIPE